MSVTSLVGLIAAASSLLFIWPQVFRVFVKKSTEGLVPLSFLQGCSGSLMWTIYGLKKSSFYIVFSNLSIVVAIYLILFVCVKHKKIAGWIPIFTLVSLAVVGTIIANYSMTLMGWCTIAIGTPAITPQIVRVYRTEHLYGVSESMYALLSICCSIWIVYGLMLGDLFVSIPNIVGTVGGFYIWLRARASHRKFARPVEATAV
ncbi:MAG: SemiSWEET family transporter [Actinomycetota bacterium]